MIIQIKPIEIEGITGLANELLIEVYNHTKTEDKVIVYYALRNSLETSSITRFETKEILTLPYKVLKSNRITIEGEDYLAYKQDSNSINSYISNLLGVTVLEEEL